MIEQDIPFLDDEIAKLPSDIREDLAKRCASDLFVFDRAVLGFHDMTKRCHGPLCVFAQHNPAQFKLILFPRDHYKTSCYTVGRTMQLFVNDPEQRILIANESAENATRMLRTIREKAEGNRVFRALYSSIIPKDTRKTLWNESELRFNREGQYAEPTVDRIGMTGAYTSRHYTHITIDDPISEEAVASEKVMKDVITRLSSFFSLLSKPETDTMTMVGTRWALFDTYSWFREQFAPFGSRFSQFACSVYDENGEPIFPELMGHEILAIKRAALGEYRFSCLYLNNPRSEELQDLNVNDLRFWRWSADESEVELLAADGSVARVARLDQLDVTTTVDLAPAERAISDRNAVVTCGITPWNEVIVLDAWGKRCTPLELIEKLFEVKQRFNPRIFGIEGVAYQKAFKYFLNDAAKRRGVYLRIEELKATGKKEIRVRGLQPIMALNRMYLLPTQALLRNEMADFPLGQFDDLVDALSMQLQLWRGRLSPEHIEKVRKEELKLIARIRKGNVPATMQPGKKRQDWDHDDMDEDDLRPREKWIDYTIDVA